MVSSKPGNLRRRVNTSIRYSGWPLDTAIVAGAETAVSCCNCSMDFSVAGKGKRRPYAMLTASESPQIPLEFPVSNPIDPSVWMGYDPQRYAATASNSYRSRDELVSPSNRVFWSGIPQLLVLLVLTSCAGPVEDVPPTGHSPTRSATNRPQAEELPTESQSGWRIGSHMRILRSEMPAVEIGGVAYVPGGFSGPLGTARFEAYDIQMNSWQNLKSMPAARHHLMATAHNGLIYVFGGSSAAGFRATSTAWRYDPKTDQWENLPPMPVKRMSGAAVTLHDTIYIVGGVGGSQKMLVFDPTQLTWNEQPGPEQPREHTAAVPYQGEIWTIAGRWRGLGELSSVEIYNPDSQSWRSGPRLEIPRGGFAAAVVGDEIFVAGGEVIMTGQTSLASLEIYNPETETWEAGPNLPFAVHGLDGIEADGKFLIFGGSHRAGAISNEGRVQIYAP